MTDSDILLEVKNLKTYFFLEEGTVRAVDGADFDIKRGTTLGVVGESGCGKSVTARSILRIIEPPGRVVDGQILYHRYLRRDHDFSLAEVVDLAQLDARSKKMREIRGGEIAIVFQEPMTSFSPVHTIGDQIIEAILLHQDVTKAEARALTIEMLQRVGMPKPSVTVDQYAFELSGGMRQRAMIAMALSCNPQLLIADEPTTALDVTTEAQILDLMRELQDQIGMAIMYITHNLGVIAEMAQQVVVMYLGKMVERADVDTVFYNAQHPYTRALLRSIPRIEDQRGRRLEAIRGIVPDPYALPSGCPFHPRCSSRMEICGEVEPPLVEVAPGHWVRCHLYG